jgi:hypothetical protein
MLKIFIDFAVISGCSLHNDSKPECLSRTPFLYVTQPAYMTLKSTVSAVN